MEDKTVVIPHGPVKISVKDIMKDMGLEYRDVKSLLSKIEVEVNSVNKKVPLEALRQIKRLFMKSSGKGDASDEHWIVGSFIESFGETMIKFREEERDNGDMLHIAVERGGKRTEFHFLKDMKAMKGAKTTKDARDVAQAIAIAKRLFKMVEKEAILGKA